MSASEGAALTATQLQELRSDLERELKRLRRSMESIATSAEPVQLEQTCVGRVSRMDAMANQQMSKALLERDQGLEVRYMDALKRMDEGSYGICEKCGEAVPYGRLLVMPEARNCAACEGA